MIAAVQNIDRAGDSEDLNEDGVEELEFGLTELSEANVVTSIQGGASASTPKDARLHYPVLDLDIDARLVPSSTPGHSHLYIDRLLSWTKYKALLRALAEAGIIEDGYAGASIARGHTAVRLPWVEKTARPTPSLPEVDDEPPF